MSRHGYHLLLFAGIVLLLAGLPVACSQPPAAEAPPPPSSEPEEPLEPEEPEEQPIYIDSIAYELKYQVLKDLTDFLKKYPIEPEQAEGAQVWVQKFHFGSGGNMYMSSWIPADNIDRAKTCIENASSLLSEGKLPTETVPMPLDKNAVARELEEAISLLSGQLAASYTGEEGSIEWAEQSDVSEINNEATVVDIVETHDDYQQRLSGMISTLERLLSELPAAIEKGV